MVVIATINASLHVCIGSPLPPPGMHSLNSDEVFLRMFEQLYICVAQGIAPMTCLCFGLNQAHAAAIVLAPVLTCSE